MKRGLLFVIFILLLPNVLAMGLRAADLNFQMDFVPNGVYSYEYQIVTNSGMTQDYELYVRGDLGQYVTLTPPKFYDVPDGATPKFTATIRFPENIDVPGIHELRIGAVETKTRGGGTIGARTGSEAIINVRVLYEQKALVAGLDTPNVNVHEPVNMKLTLENWGKTDIESAKAVITVYDLSNKTMAVLNTEKTSVPASGSSELYAILDTIGYLPGQYLASANIVWDGNLTTVQDYFRIGELIVDITSYTKTLITKKINPFSIVVESGWNDPIENVWAEMTIGNRKIQTPTTKLAPWESKSLTAYLDTSGMEPGDYDVKIVLHYADKTDTKLTKVRLEDEIVPAKSILPSISTTNLVIILIVLLAVINLLLLIYFQKKSSCEVKQNGGQ